VCFVLVSDDRLHFHIRDGIRYLALNRKGKKILDGIAQKKSEGHVHGQPPQVFLNCHRERVGEGILPIQLKCFKYFYWSTKFPCKVPFKKSGKSKNKFCILF
jgi:hypothetical protein